MTELKLCPFCGKEAVQRETSHGHSGAGIFTARIYVGCDDCKIGFSRESQFSLQWSNVVFSFDGYKDAKERWNRRAGDD